jgi:hypothetical protein
MRSRGGLVGCALVVTTLLVSTAPLTAQRIPLEKRFFNEQVLRPSGQPVVPIFEGWYANADGSHDLCFGYFNLNLDEAVDVPLGEGNALEPIRYDGRQPTHFTPVPGMSPASPFTSRFRRAWCTFTVAVPPEFGPDDRVTWTLQREGGPPVSTSGTLNVAYVLDEPQTSGRGDVAPTLRLSESGPAVQGRRGLTAAPRTARVGQPMELTAWVEHPFESQAWVGWLHYKGPGAIRFGPAEQRIQLEEGAGVAHATATFDAPGDYEILVQTINSTASFEYHCCWTNGYIPVHVVE